MLFSLAKKRSLLRKPVLLVSCLLVASVARADSPGVRVEGGSSELRDNVHAHLNIDFESCDIPAWREATILRKARQDTRRALQAMGHYQPRLELSIERENDCWTVVVSMEPGEPVRFRDIHVRVTGEAATDPVFRAIREDPPLQPGQPLHHERYEQLRKRLIQQAEERGYFDHELLEHRLEVDVLAGTADVHLHLASGPRYRFGPVSFEQDVLNEELIQRFVRFEPGDEYDHRKVLALRQALSGSNYFTEVRIQARHEEAEDLRVPIGVTASPRPKHSFLAGVGFATDIGPRLRLGYENRRLNRHGHRYQAEMETSPVRSGIGFNYEIPLADPSRERVNLSADFRREETDTSLSKRYRLGAAHMRELDSGWMLTRSLEFEREFFTVSEQRDRTDLVMPGIELSRSRSDDPVYPRRGWRLNGKIRGAHEDLASSVRFGQFRGRGKAILPLLAGRVLGRVEFGTTSAKEVVILPSSVRFFAGGDHSVRGYGYQRLGPEDDEGNIIGGRHLLVGSLEYDYPILGQWSLATFVDGGNAFDDFDEYEPAYGVGVGVRWRSPIGPIRLDVAHPDDRRDDFRIHVSMGMDL